MRINSTMYQPQTTYPWENRVYVPLFVVIACCKAKRNPMLMFLSHHLCCNVFNGYIQRNELKAHEYSVISFALLKRFSSHTHTGCFERNYSLLYIRIFSVTWAYGSQRR